MRSVLFIIVIISCFAPVLSKASSGKIFNHDIVEQLEKKKFLYAPFSLKRLYKENNYSLVWNDKRLEALINSIKKIDKHGLTPSDYHLDELTSNELTQTQRDIYATDAYLSLAGHLLGGKLNPVSMEQTWTAKGREVDLVLHLQKALNKENIRSSLEELSPQQPQYKKLQASLNSYRKLEGLEEWKKITLDKPLKQGESGKSVQQIRSRLVTLGYVEKETGSELYDDELVDGVTKFQQLANLEPDGIVGAETLRKLNRTLQDRVNQIRVNLERWRWLPENLGEKHIRVNIADYKLEVYSGSESVHTHDVIVGRDYRQTPVFSGNMTYIVLNPWWEVPTKLARIDILPKFQKDPQIIDRLGYQIIDLQGNIETDNEIDWSEYSQSYLPFRLRQKPGLNNALGRVKFMFPNEHNVYLHDTPSRELFDKTRRDFSSGCIRVKNPLELAAWILKENNDWNRGRVDNIVESGKETTVSLKQNIPVHLLYWTVVANNDEVNGIRFIDDIYKRDERVLMALSLPPTKR